MPKVRSKRKLLRKNPLAIDIESDAHEGVIKKKSRIKKSKFQNEDEYSGSSYIPENLSKKLLKQIKSANEEERSDDEGRYEAINNVKREPNEHEEMILDIDAENEDHESFDKNVEEESEECEVVKESAQFGQKQSGGVSGKINPDLDRLKDLSKLVMKKFNEYEMASREKGLNTISGNNKEFYIDISEFDNKVIESYILVGKILKDYTSGKLPRAFTIIPHLSNWDKVLLLTRPEQWSFHAVYAATKLFVSNLSCQHVKKYYSMVLLPHIHKNIKEKKKLDHHLYMALKKSTYKPEAFYKGILLPLCESEEFTIKEALILGGIIKKVSIPVMHSSVALLKLMKMPNPSTKIILIIEFLIYKKYALPYRILDELVTYFLSVNNTLEKGKIPVIWHQTLLLFVQIYKNDLLVSQKDQIMTLIANNRHKLISPEIKNELLNSKSRDELDEAKMEIDTENEKMILD